MTESNTAIFITVPYVSTEMLQWLCTNAGQPDDDWWSNGKRILFYNNEQSAVLFRLKFGV